ncbi:MAG: putative peptide formylmethionine deformylase [uncultured marine phage]|uniref:Putative peptide formylmethionine deformylase n=1 Tax=uncultured marine phage TaxID=707152 RepID=A0A8D9CBM5_9VIRU|nr:MAG: putative peptide formylmethionine deformylase [uncultured marine phage]
MNINKFGAKILRKVARNVRNDFPVEDYAHSMFTTLKKTGGVGLALPQVGESKRMFVININGIRKIFVNPTIEFMGEKTIMNEGCLSIPGIEMSVLRYEKIKVHYWNEHWEEMNEEFTGVVARVIQHEYDHLDGILFIDYLSDDDRKEIRGQLDKISSKLEKSFSMPRYGSTARASFNYGGTTNNRVYEPIESTNEDVWDDLGEDDGDDFEAL